MVNNNIKPVICSGENAMEHFIYYIISRVICVFDNMINIFFLFFCSLVSSGGNNISTNISESRKKENCIYADISRNIPISSVIFGGIHFFFWVKVRIFSFLAVFHLSLSPFSHAP